jgi:F-type H+-transporting ATPase subunit a
LVIIPFIILIELVSNISRIVSLSVRLFANMTSGHALLKILSGFALVAGSILAIWKFLLIFPVCIIIIITGLEMLIAFLQTYVLVTLLLIYSSEQE